MTSEYPDIRIRPNLDPDGKYDWFEVVQTCVVKEMGVSIPEGYITDFASVPRWLWPLIPPHGRAAGPSVLHDFMYTSKLFSAWLTDDGARAAADLVFYHKLREIGIKKWQAKAMYWAVRLFGKKRYGNDSRPYRNKKTIL